MEIFLDGGLFELTIAIATGYIINYIFLKKYLLILFSVAVITAPVMILFISRGELYYFLSGFTIINALFLILLLWKQRSHAPREPLINIEKYRKKVMNQARRLAGR